MTDGAIRRAIAALRTGRPVRIEGVQPLGIVAVECATAEMLELLDGDSTARLLISGPRAAALGLGNQRDSAAPDLPVLLERSPWLDQRSALALADPGQDFERGPIGPLTPLTNDHMAQSAAAIRLARSAGLLPALWLVDPDAAALSLSPDSMSASA
ncbi:MAG: GTP cyclohydrolase II, partial [Sphingomicrobium sp.]